MWSAAVLAAYLRGSLDLCRPRLTSGDSCPTSSESPLFLSAHKHSYFCPNTRLAVPSTVNSLCDCGWNCVVVSLSHTLMRGGAVQVRQRQKQCVSCCSDVHVRTCRCVCCPFLHFLWCHISIRGRRARAERPSLRGHEKGTGRLSQHSDLAWGLLKGQIHISLSIPLFSLFPCVFHFWNIISNTWAVWQAWGYFGFSCPYNELVNRCLQALVRITSGQVFHWVLYISPISKAILLWVLFLQSQQARLGTTSIFKNSTYGKWTEMLPSVVLSQVPILARELNTQNRPVWWLFTAKTKK